MPRLSKHGAGFGSSLSDQRSHATGMRASGV